MQEAIEATSAFKQQISEQNGEPGRILAKKAKFPPQGPNSTSSTSTNEISDILILPAAIDIVEILICAKKVQN